MSDLEAEIWRPVGDWPYEVSNVGRVRRSSAKRGRARVGYVLSPGITRYAQVVLFDGERKRRSLVHRLVAEAFVPNQDCAPQINHKNGDKLDNRAGNLEWVQPHENLYHAQAVLGTRNTTSPLAPEDVRAIRRRYRAGGTTQRALAKEYGKSQGAIAAICTRKSRRWVGD